MADTGEQLRPRKGKGGKWFVGAAHGLSFETKEEALAHIAKGGGGSTLRAGPAPYLMLGAVIVVGVAGYAFFGRDKGPAKCGDEVMAYVMSQKPVESRLRSPSSAKFPTIPEAKSVRTGECTFRIVSYVDAQNGFGATIRSFYTAEMEYLPIEQKWRALDVNVEK